MTAQLLARAVAVAYNPKSSPDELWEVVGDLLSFGALEAADEALRKLRADGKFLGDITRLESMSRWFRDLGPQFADRRLTGAMAIVRDDHATDQQLTKAAESLVSWGSLDEADTALSRLRERGHTTGTVARLTSASHQLRRSGIQQELQSLTTQKSLNKPYEVLIRRKPGAQRTIIVFTGIAFRFWLSLNALHLFLKKLDANVIYLSDHSAAMFVNGLETVGPGYGAMVEMLRQQLTSLGPTMVHVLATSAGGFVGLRTAIDLQAESFAGMSIRSDLAPLSTIRTTPFERHVINACRDPDMRIDLLPLLEASEFPRRVQLYCGDFSKTDIAHSEHLRSVSRVHITYLEAHHRHDVVSGLIARGLFGEVLARFIGTSDPPLPAGATRPTDEETDGQE